MYYGSQVITFQTAALTSRTKRQHRSDVKIVNDLSYVDVDVGGTGGYY
jgi:hypothetical protein